MTARHKQLSRTDSDDKQCREQAGLERTNFHERQVSHSKGEGEWRGASALKAEEEDCLKGEEGWWKGRG